MRTIWKYPIGKEFSQVIELPEGAEFLTLQVQHGRPYVWAMVDSTKPKTKRFLEIVGTGGEVPDGFRYLGTWQAGLGVWHAFVS